MGIMDRLFKGEDEFVESEEYENDEEEVVEEKPAATPASNRSGNSVKPTGSVSTGAALEMKIIIPETIDDAKIIGQHLLSKRTVVINLKKANPETAHKILQFVSGVIFAIDGDFKKVGDDTTYIAVPKNVEVTDQESKVQQQDAAPKQTNLF